VNDELPPNLLSVLRCGCSPQPEPVRIPARFFKPLDKDTVFPSSGGATQKDNPTDPRNCCPRAVGNFSTTEGTSPPAPEQGSKRALVGTTRSHFPLAPRMSRSLANYPLEPAGNSLLLNMACSPCQCFTTATLYAVFPAGLRTKTSSGTRHFPPAQPL